MASEPFGEPTHAGGNGVLQRRSLADLWGRPEPPAVPAARFEPPTQRRTLADLGWGAAPPLIDVNTPDNKDYVVQAPPTQPIGELGKLWGKPAPDKAPRTSQTPETNELTRRAAEAQAELETYALPGFSGLSPFEKQQSFNAVRVKYGLGSATLPEARTAGAAAGEQFATGGGLARKLPIVGGIADARHLWRVYRAAKRIEAGRAQEGDFPLLVEFQEELAENARPRTIGAGVVETVGETIPFALEFAATGGLAALARAGVRKLTGKVVAETAEKSAAKAIRDLAEHQTAKGLTKAAAVGLGKTAGRAAVQTGTVSLPRAVAATIERRIPGYQLDADDQGELQAVFAEPAAEWWPAIRDGLGDTYIEVFSEGTGETIGLLGRAAGKAAPKFIRVPADKVGEFLARVKTGAAAEAARLFPESFPKIADAARFLKTAGFHGVAAEMGEERIGDLLRVAAREAGAETIQPGSIIPSAEQATTEFLAFALTGAALRGLGAGVSRLEKPRDIEKGLLRKDAEPEYRGDEAGGPPGGQVGGRGVQPAAQPRLPDEGETEEITEIEQEGEVEAEGQAKAAPDALLGPQKTPSAPEVPEYRAVPARGAWAVVNRAGDVLEGGLPKGAAEAVAIRENERRVAPTRPVIPKVTGPRFELRERSAEGPFEIVDSASGKRIQTIADREMAVRLVDAFNEFRAATPETERTAPVERRRVQPAAGEGTVSSAGLGASEPAVPQAPTSRLAPAPPPVSPSEFEPAFAGEPDVGLERARRISAPLVSATELPEAPIQTTPEGDLRRVKTFRAPPQRAVTGEEVPGYQANRFPNGYVRIGFHQRPPKAVQQRLVNAGARWNPQPGVRGWLMPGYTEHEINAIIIGGKLPEEAARPRAIPTPPSITVAGGGLNALSEAQAREILTYKADKDLVTTALTFRGFKWGIPEKGDPLLIHPDGEVAYRVRRDRLTIERRDFQKGGRWQQEPQIGPPLTYKRYAASIRRKLTEAYPNLAPTPAVARGTLERSASPGAPGEARTDEGTKGRSVPSGGGLPAARLTAKPPAAATVPAKGTLERSASPGAPGEARRHEGKEKRKQRSGSVLTSEPRELSVEYLRQAFELSEAKAVAVQAFIEATGIDLARLRVAKGGDTVPEALLQKKEKAERRFRRQLRELEGVRDQLTDGQRREVNAARRNLKIHNWWHYSQIIGAIHRKHFGAPGTEALPQEAKAAVEFIEGGIAVLRGLQNPDVSSAIHEIAHVARRFLFDRSVPEAERAGITEHEIGTLELWAGVKKGVWTREAEERFARAFERYIREGRAPTDGLKSLFAKLARWLKQIYKKIAGSPIDIDITPGIRHIFGLAFKEVREKAVADRAFGETVAKVQAPKTASEALQRHKARNRYDARTPQSVLRRDQEYQRLSALARSERAKQAAAEGRAAKENMAQRRADAVERAKSGVIDEDVVRFVPLRQLPAPLRGLLQAEAQVTLRELSRNASEATKQALEKIIAAENDSGYPVEVQKQGLFLRLTGEKSRLPADARFYGAPEPGAYALMRFYTATDPERRKAVITEAIEDFRASRLNDLVDQAHQQLGPKPDDPFPMEPEPGEVEAWLESLAKNEPVETPTRKVLAKLFQEAPPSEPGEPTAPPSMEEIRAEVAKLKAEGKFTPFEQTEWKPTDADRKLIAEYAAGANVPLERFQVSSLPETTTWSSGFFDALAARMLKAGRRSFRQMIGRGAVAYWGVPEFLWRGIERVRGAQKLARHEAGRAYQPIEREVRSIAKRESREFAKAAGKRETWSQYSERLKAVREKLDRTFEDVIRGDADIEDLTPSQRETVNQYIRLARWLSDYWLSNEWTWPYLMKAGHTNLLEIIAFKRTGKGAYLKRLYETIPGARVERGRYEATLGGLAGFQAERFNRGVRLRLSSLMPRRGDEELFTVVNALDPRHPRFRQVVSREEAAEVAKEWIREHQQQYGERVYEKIRVLDPFSIDDLKGAKTLQFVVAGEEAAQAQVQEIRKRGSAATARAMVNKDGEPIYNQDRVQLWRVTAESPVFGEAEPTETYGVVRPVRDSRLLMAQSLVDQLNNVRVMEFYKLAADTVARDTNPEPGSGAWVYVPDAPEFGPLGGKWVPEPVAFHLFETERVSTGFYSRLWQLIEYAWKSSKVVWNFPDSLFRNIFGLINFTVLDTMTPFDAPWLLRAFRLIRANDHRWTRLVAENEARVGWNAGELDRLEQMFARDPESVPLAVQQWVENHPRLTAALKRGAGTVGEVNRVLGEIYDLPDQVLKFASYLKKTEKQGMSHEDALRALWMYQNYERLGRAARGLRRSLWGTPFVAFSAETARIYARAVRERPARMLVLATMPLMLNTIAKVLFGVDDDEEELLNETDPRRKTWQGRYFRPMIWRNADGRMESLNLTWIYPGASELGLLNERGGLKLPFIMSHPWVSLGYELAYNRDDFIGRPIWNDVDALPVKLAKMMGKIGSEVLPLPPDLARPHKSMPVRLIRAAVGESKESFARAVARELFGVRIEDAWADRDAVFKLLKAKYEDQDLDSYWRIMAVYDEAYRTERDTRIRSQSVRQSVRRDKKSRENMP